MDDEKIKNNKTVGANKHYEGNIHVLKSWTYNHNSSGVFISLKREKQCHIRHSFGDTIAWLVQLGNGQSADSFIIS